MSRRRLSRQKKTAIIIAAAGTAVGVGIVAFWPQIKRFFASFSTDVPLLKGKATNPEWKRGSDKNIAFNRAQDAWYALNPNVPFVNDDGTYNILPGYEF